MLFVGQATRSI